jgi:hypothetical protein
MPTPTYTPLATVTLGSSTSTVTLSNIPASYRDLILILTPRTTARSFITVRLNGDSGSNYTAVGAYVTGGGSPDSFAAGYTQLLTNGNSPAGNNSNTLHIQQIMDYSATDKHKIALSRAQGIEPSVDMTATRWANTAAVTSITIGSGSETFVSGASFNLYGISA